MELKFNIFKIGYKYEKKLILINENIFVILKKVFCYLVFIL